MANNEAEVPEVEDKYAELREHYASGEALTDVEIDTIADIAVGHVRGILTFFGEEGEGFMRVNFACPRSQLAEGIKRVKAALEDEE